MIIRCSFPVLSKRHYITIAYKLARFLNGYKLERTDLYSDVLALVDFADTEYAKEAQQQNQQTIG